MLDLYVSSKWDVFVEMMQLWKLSKGKKSTNLIPYLATYLIANYLGGFGFDCIVWESWNISFSSEKLVEFFGVDIWWNCKLLNTLRQDYLGCKLWAVLIARLFLKLHIIQHVVKGRKSTQWLDLGELIDDDMCPRFVFWSDPGLTFYTSQVLEVSYQEVP